MGKPKKRQHAATNEDAVLGPEAAVIHKAAKKAKLANGSAKPTATVSSVEEEGSTLSPAPAPAPAAVAAEAAGKPARKERKKKKSKQDSKKDKDERKEKKDGKIRDKEGKKPRHAIEDLVASNDDDQAMGEGDGMNGNALGAEREIQAINGEEKAEAASEAQADTVPNGDGSKDKKKAKEEKKAKKDKKNKEEKKDKKSRKAKKSAEQDLAPTQADENGAGADEDEGDDDDGSNANENGEGGKAARFICFIGNLPFTATSETVRAHFSALQPASVRLLTQRDDAAQSRGIAFVEFASYDRMRTCLTKFHHSEFNDGVSPARKINVELTAGGGGTTKIRKDKIKAKNEKLNEERHKKAEEAKQLKKEGKDVEGEGDGEDTSESRGQGEHNAIHPSRLAMMQGPELEEKQQQQRGQGRGGRGGGGRGSRGGAAGHVRSQHGRWQQKSRR